MTPFWWACWTAWQTGDEQLQPLPRGQPVRVAVLGDRHALDQLHDEERPAGRRSSRRRAPWRCSGGPSGPGPAARPRTGPAPACESIPGLISLSATCGWTGSVCSATTDGAHPALADRLQQLVPPDEHRAGPPSAARRSAARAAVRRPRRPGAPGTPPAWSWAREQRLDPAGAGRRRRRTPRRGRRPGRPASARCRRRRGRSASIGRRRSAMGGSGRSLPPVRSPARRNRRRRRNSRRRSRRVSRRPAGRAARPGRTPSAGRRSAGETPRAAAASLERSARRSTGA